MTILAPQEYELLEDAAYGAGMEFQSYSGRGMYGTTCIGVTGDIAQLIRMVLLVAEVAPDLAQKLAEVSTDNMGLDYIYYWTSIQGTEH